MPEDKSKIRRRLSADADQASSFALGHTGQAEARDSVLPTSAFDIWLDRGLHKLYDRIAQEPVPDALLKIIEQAREKD